MRRVIKHALRHPRLTAWLRGIYHEGKAEGLAGHGPETSVAEATPIDCRKSVFQGQRLNLLVPSLSLQHLFGGISTALSLFEALAVQAGLDNLRIILTEQQYFKYADNPAFSHWQISSLAQDDAGRCIVAAGDRHGKTLAVGPGDHFIATAWWTAVSARSIQEWQVQTWHLPEPLRFLYLIQDYEPGFYPWSSRYALAEATYHDAGRFVALFNTGLLQSYFIQQGYCFPSAVAFEPVLHPSLSQQREQLRDTPKEQRLLVYGRPGVVRNAFELAVMGLRAWIDQGGATDWTFVSAGEPHPAVDLGHGAMLHSLGKLSLEQYAHELSRASVGLSLMISPHPSYPPLEMAAFGMYVVSNCYGPKKLGNLHPAILSADPLTPEAIAAQLECAARCSLMQELSTVSVTETWQRYLSGNGGFGELAGTLLQQMGVCHAR